MSVYAQFWCVGALNWCVDAQYAYLGGLTRTVITGDLRSRQSTLISPKLSKILSAAVLRQRVTPNNSRRPPFGILKDLSGRLRTSHARYRTYQATTITDRPPFPLWEIGSTQDSG